MILDSIVGYSCHLVDEVALWLLGLVGEVVLHRRIEDDGGKVGLQAAITPPGVGVLVLLHLHEGVAVDNGG